MGLASVCIGLVIAVGVNGSTHKVIGAVAETLTNAPVTTHSGRKDAHPGPKRLRPKTPITAIELVTENGRVLPPVKAALFLTPGALGAGQSYEYKERFPLTVLLSEEEMLIKPDAQRALLKSRSTTLAEAHCRAVLKSFAVRCRLDMHQVFLQADATFNVVSRMHSVWDRSIGVLPQVARGLVVREQINLDMVFFATGDRAARTAAEAQGHAAINDIA